MRPCAHSARPNARPQQLAHPKVVAMEEVKCMEALPLARHSGDDVEVWGCHERILRKPCVPPIRLTMPAAILPITAELSTLANVADTVWSTPCSARSLLYVGARPGKLIRFTSHCQSPVVCRDGHLEHPSPVLLFPPWSSIKGASAVTNSRMA